VAWTGARIRLERRLTCGGLRPHGDSAGEVAGERWGAATRGCASGAGSGLRGKIEWWCRGRRLGEAARHSVGHRATAGEGVC
jgi:hypothetical protein